VPKPVLSDAAGGVEGGPPDYAAITETARKAAALAR